MCHIDVVLVWHVGSNAVVTRRHQSHPPTLPHYHPINLSHHVLTFYLLPLSTPLSALRHFHSVTVSSYLLHFLSHPFLYLPVHQGVCWAQNRRRPAPCYRILSNLKLENCCFKSVKFGQATLVSLRFHCHYHRFALTRK